MKRGLRVIAVGAIAMLAGAWLQGCGDSGPVVNVYSARSHYGTEDVFKQFTKQTGIRVEILGGEPAALVDRIKAEGERTKADVLITTDAGYLWRATQLGLLAPAGTPAMWRTVPANLRDPKDRWIAISRRARTVMRAVQRVNEAHAPTTYAELGDPRWKGRLCLRTSNSVYNQSLVATLIAERGEAPVKAMLKAWMANDPIILGSDTEVLDAMQQGRCDIGLTNTYYLGNKVKEDPAFPVAPVWVEQQGVGTHVNVSGAGITTHAQHPEEALKLLRYLITPEAQRMIADGNSEYPVVQSVPMAPWIRGWGTFTPDRTAVVKAGEFQPQAVRMMNEVGWK